MPWNQQGGGGNWNNGGGGGGGRGPWGQGPQGGGGGQGGGSGGSGGNGPDLDEILRRGQDRLKKMGGGPSAGIIILLLFIVGAIWLGSGFYRVNEGQQAAVLRFGEFVGTRGVGLQYHLPYPIESVEIESVTQVRRVDVGTAAPGNRVSTDPGLMLTGDENIVDINFNVLWRINSLEDYLFNVEDPTSTVRTVAESAVREVIGQTPLQPILTQDRGAIQDSVKTLMQSTLDAYGAGVQVIEVQLQKADPPQQVIEAFRDVQSAEQDQVTTINQARAYANKVVPEARGEAQRIIEGAEGYKARVTEQATGEAARFLSVFEEYREAPVVTRQRLFLETMERVLSRSNKIIVDGEAGSGVVPYLPLPEVQKRQQAERSQGGSNTSGGGNQ